MPAHGVGSVCRGLNPWSGASRSGPLARRDRGKGTLMRLSLRNLLGRRTGTRPARPRPRPGGADRLHVERLEERAVPAAFNLLPYIFTMPGVGSFHATFETPAGYFGGSFTDFKSGITAQGSGQLVHLNGTSYDHIFFRGEGQKLKPLETELVVLDGLLYEGPAAPPQIRGKLTEADTLFIPPAPPLHWTVTQPFDGIA